MKQFFSGNSNIVNKNGNYFERPRLHEIMRKAMEYPLVVVCAGSGYGKTRAVYSFLREYGAHTTWIQLSERDNVEARFWESYVKTTSKSWPETGARLQEIGFPDTEEAYAKYEWILQDVINHPEENTMVFDDFHLLKNPVVLRFFNRAFCLASSNTKVIVISRTMPDVNLIGMMMRESVFMIQEDALCFKADEIAEYFNRLNLAITRGEIQNIYNDTQGWAFAVNLIGRSLIKGQKYERYALEAMKKNIFRLVEAEISETISDELWRFLLRISLIDHMAAGLIKAQADNDSLINEMELLNAYIRYDFHQDTYMINHLFLEYLRRKQDQLTTEEKRETYRAAGTWYEANGYCTEAFSYYEKGRHYSAIIKKAALFNIQIPSDMARHTLEIFDRIPKVVKSMDPLFPGLHIRLKVNLGQINEETAELVDRYAKNYEVRPESPERNCALSNIYGSWAFFRMFMCSFDDVYDYDIYYKKMSKHLSQSPYKTLPRFTILPISSWASLVGTNRVEAQEESISAISRSIFYVSSVEKGLLAGFDDLLRGELYFYRGELNDAERYLKLSLDKACVNNQYSTQNRAWDYLMKIALIRGDFASATKSLQGIESLLSEEDYDIRYTMFDIAQGFFQLTLEQPEQIPEWLKCDFSNYTYSVFLENYVNRVKARYHYQTNQHNALLAFVENAMEKQTVLFGKIEINILKALSLYKLKRRGEAIGALTEAWRLAESNKIIVLFTQHAKDMRTLTAAAMKDITCQIPRIWLEDINRKASAFARRKTHIISEYMTADSNEAGFALTERETEVLRDLSHGLSRTEIAASQNISINTVKMVINVIYDKLHVFNLSDAIRVAISTKIV